MEFHHVVLNGYLDHGKPQFSGLMLYAKVAGFSWLQTFFCRAIHMAAVRAYVVGLGLW